MYAMKMQKAGTKRGRKKASPWPLLMEEIILEILLRLPAKSLLRFRSVCKAWRAMIDQPMFIRDHLRHSASKSQCFIISPHTLDEPPFSDHFRFYQWQLQPKNNVATFLYSKDFPGQLGLLRDFIAHCDGLVFARTGSNLYLFNPATRDAVTLPNSPRDNLRAAGCPICHCAGLGLDPRTGKYKVVQAFYRSLDPDTGMGTDMGMEVFTVAGDDDGRGGSWREIRSNPPYSAERFEPAVAVGGFMFWHLAGRQLERELCGILHLTLEDEEFGVTGLPNRFNPDDGEFMLDVLRGRDLCLTSCNRAQKMLNIWTLPVADEGLTTPWRWQHSIQFSGLCHTMSLPPVSNGVILWQAVTHTVYCYDLATSKLSVLCDLRRLRFQRGRNWKKLYYFHVEPFTESLVRIT